MISVVLISRPPLRSVPASSSSPSGVQVIKGYFSCRMILKGVKASPYSGWSRAKKARSRGSASLPYLTWGLSPMSSGTVSPVFSSQSCTLVFHGEMPRRADASDAPSPSLRASSHSVLSLQMVTRGVITASPPQSRSGPLLPVWSRSRRRYWPWLSSSRLRRPPQ